MPLEEFNQFSNKLAVGYKPSLVEIICSSTLPISIYLVVLLGNQNNVNKCISNAVTMMKQTGLSNYYSQEN